MKIAMPVDETKALKNMIDEASIILEYGSGGSTIYGGKSNAKAIISTENDKKFLDKVVAEYNKDGPLLVPIHVYVGETKMWGYPINKDYQHRWPEYPVAPWNMAKEKGIDPDTIIIDGRFRVACFLYSIGHAKPGTIIFWDDYVNRGSYHAVEDICKPRKTIGRAAVFIKEDETFHQDMFDKYCNDMR
jgi:hypothetical protein